MNCVGTSCLSETNFETYTNVLEILKENSSCAVVQPTGTGKSYIMMELLKTFKDTWKIVIAPSRDFLNNLEQNKYWVSEKTLTLTYSFIGINCTNIEGILADYKINPDSVGLIIVDEMHRAGAPKWGAGVTSLMSICKNAKTVGLTATPKRLDEDRNMVDELFEGRVARNMNLAEAVRLGLVPLLNYTVGMHDIEYNISELQVRVTDKSYLEYIYDMLEDYHKKWDFTNYFVYTLNKYINTDNVEGKHIIFASSIEEAEKMAGIVGKWFQKLYNTNTVNVYCIHSKEAKKSQYMEEFFSDNKVGEVKVAVAVNMLNESFHCRDIKTISMFRGTQSLNVYMQQIGRAITAGGDVPYIFDFVDNYNSIESLHEMLTIDNMMELEEVYDTKSFVFNEFNDETVNFVRDMTRVKRLINLDISETVKEIKRRLPESDDGTIFSVPDDKFITWAEYALNCMSIFKIADKDAEELIVSYDICKSFGREWYKKYRVYLQDRGKLSEKELKSFRASFNKISLLNSFSEKTINFFKERGLSSNITSNEEKLRSLLSKNETKDFKHKDTLLMLPSLQLGDVEMNGFGLYKALVKLEEYFSDRPRKSWTNEMIGDACAYWLWQIYSEKYGTYINEVKTKYADYLYIDEFMKTSKRCKYEAGIEVVHKINELVCGKSDLSELTEEALDIFTYHKIKKMERVYDCMCKNLHIDVDEDNLKDRLHGQAKLGYIDSRLMDYAESIKKSASNHINVDNLEWIDVIMERYNKLIEVCDAIINYDETDQSDVNWLYQLIQSSRDEYLYSKSKKSNLIYNSKPNNKLDTLCKIYQDIEELKGELDVLYLDDFVNKYNEAKVEWEKLRYIKDTDTLFISMIALSRSELCRNNIGVNKIKYRLQKAIITIFDWLVVADSINASSIDMTDTMKGLKLMFELMGEDTWYLASSAFSKKNRELGIQMYRLFMSTGRILTKSAVSFFEDTTDRDTQLLYDIKNSKTIQNLDRLSAFYKTLVSTYENMDI